MYTYTCMWKIPQKHNEEKKNDVVYLSATGYHQTAHGLNYQDGI